jgi:hypothetical protein
MKRIPEVIKFEKDLKILNFSDFSDFKNAVDTIATTHIDLFNVRRLAISGSTIDNFDFLESLPALKQLSFLACQSDNWSDLKGNKNINSLRLHNLKQGKLYLSSIDFIHTFSKLQYLYSNMLGIDNFSELKSLQYLLAIFCVCRNENDIKKQFDLSALEFLPRLKIFDTSMAVDRHRIPAESLIPVLKNPSISSVTVTQMYKTEDRKLQKLIEVINPLLLDTNLSHDEIMTILKSNFAW